MSSPSDSITDIDDIASNKKRGRAQSVEPSMPLAAEEELSEEKPTAVSALKKTKRDEEENTTSVSTIRRNMKDMSTTDKQLSESPSTVSNDSQEDEQMTSANEENKAVKAFSQFGGKGDEDDWGEFEEEETVVEKEIKPKEEESQPKYTFGASSGFGSKGWAASHKTIPPPSKQPNFGGFGTSSFGGFRLPTSTTDITTTNVTFTSNTTADSNAPASVPSFSSFAKATTSPFATAAVGNNSSINSLTQVTSPTTSSNSLEGEKDSDDNESENETDHTFGENAKIKVPGVVQQIEIKTGEEDEDTIYQTKAKLFIVDNKKGSIKERGVGTFRIKAKDEESKRSTHTRLLMRADSVFKVILNISLYPGMKIELAQERFIRFMAFEQENKADGSIETIPVHYALRLNSPATARRVYDEITSCIPDSESSTS
ncbi:hypothetical protein BDB01DRAFT_788168 [Pilobolus umbonatus]|nr:hypothetical protein BDB01DRAFT_788168 [Pilobolus umbonatus]